MEKPSARLFRQPSVKYVVMNEITLMLFIISAVILWGC
jgi:hypothetical protein